MGVDFVDFTDLQRRGILKRPIQTVERDTLDLTQTLAPSVSSAPTSPSQETSSAFDFLSGFAQASAAETSTPSPVMNHSSNSSDIDLKLSTIVNKLDDTLYKIELMSTRLSQLESRFKQ